MYGPPLAVGDAIRTAIVLAGIGGPPSVVDQRRGDRLPIVGYGTLRSCVIVVALGGCRNIVLPSYFGATVGSPSSVVVGRVAGVRRVC
jgi:hypothetical protein